MPIGADVTVVDASAIVALLADAGPTGRWAAGSLRTASLAAPQLMPFEAANVLRRQSARGALAGDQAALAHLDLVALPVQLWPYEALAGRAWELRDNATAHDAAYIALAEMLECPLTTCDARIASVPGLRCDVLVPPPGSGSGR